MRRNLLALLACLLVGAAVAAQEPAPDASPPLMERADPLLFLIVPEKSDVAFDARATLHRFTGVSREVEGRVEAIPVAVEQTSRGAVSVKAASLKTGNRLRDRNMRTMLETDRYPDIRFTLGQVKIKQMPTAEERAATLLVSGQLQVRDVTRPLQLPVTVVPGTDTIVITGQFPLTFTELGLTPPTLLFVKVDNQMTIRFRLVARLVAS
ncbi:MAG: YceI family protein [Nitrospirota bacterium]